jgi:hypothetical protein
VCDSRVVDVQWVQVQVPGNVGMSRQCNTLVLAYLPRFEDHRKVISTYSKSIIEQRTGLGILTVPNRSSSASDVFYPVLSGSQPTTNISSLHSVQKSQPGVETQRTKSLGFSSPAKIPNRPEIVVDEDLKAALKESSLVDDNLGSTTIAHLSPPNLTTVILQRLLSQLSMHFKSLNSPRS